VDYNLNEFLEEYDHLTKQVQDNGHKELIYNLNKWLDFLRSSNKNIRWYLTSLATRVDKEYLLNDVFPDKLTSKIKFNIPDDKYDRLSAYLMFFF
jgi:hypothetical protein